MVDSIEKPLELYYGNEPTVFCAHNNKSSGAVKNIDIKFYVVMEQVQDQTIYLEHNRTNKMLADPLTKGVDSQVWHLLRPTGLTGRADRSDRSG